MVRRQKGAIRTNAKKRIVIAIAIEREPPAIPLSCLERERGWEMVGALRIVGIWRQERVHVMPILRSRGYTDTNSGFLASKFG